MTINKPETIFVKFNSPYPKKFEVYRDNELYFERFLDGNTSNIKFNIPNNGNYYFNVPVKEIKRTNIIIPNLGISLPPYERNRIKDFTIVTNRSLKGSPLRIFTNEGIIERGERFFNYPKPMRVFLMLHEVSHFYYKTEKYCDLMALVMFVDMGYNISTAMYCLTNILSQHPTNDERIMYIYNNLKKQGFA